jgi:general secretion pathway protein D
MTSVLWKFAPLLLTLALAGCAAERFHREGASLLAEGRSEEGLKKLYQAHQTDPSNGKFKKDWLAERDSATAKLMKEASRDRSEQKMDAAAQRYARVLSLDPGHIGAQQAATEINLERNQIALLDEASLFYGKGDFDQANNLISRVLIENPANLRALQLRGQITEATRNNSLNGASLNLRGRKPVTLQFRDANLRMVMEALARTTGLNVLFDKDVKADLKVTIFVRDTPVEEAIDLILMQTQTAKRVMGENSILIYPDTETKSREYAELKIRRFSMTNADPKNVMAMIKTMTKTKDMFVDEKTNALVVRDTPQIIRMIEKLISAMDQPEAEVMLEVDVMEVSRDRLLALGIDLPTSFATSVTSLTIDQLKALGRNDFLSNSGVKVTASQTNDDVNTLATPRIRVRNKEKAKFLVGDRLPVISTASVPSAGGTGNPIQNTTVQYVEVGIKIETEPTIYADGEVAIRMSLEVSSAGAPNALAAAQGTIAYPIGTRSLTTVLRLKDGQTEIIGGLIQDEDKHGIAGLPGLIELPLVGRLFGKQTDTKNKKEIIMSITPRIIRNNRQIDSDLLEMWSGTENNMRFGARQLGNPKLHATASLNSPQPTAGTVSVLTSASTAPAIPLPAPAPAPLAIATPAPIPATAATLAAPPAATDTPTSGSAATATAVPAPTPRAIPAPAAKGPTTLAPAPAPRTPSPATAPPIGANTPGRATALAPGVNPRPLIQAPRQPVTQSAAAITPKVALKPLTVSAPQNAQVGETIAVTVSFPPLTAATNLETSVSFDAERLRLVNVTDADSTKNTAQGNRFTGEADGNNSVRIELAAGRGETLSASGGPLARLQFEVLATTGPTQLSVDNAAFTSAENGTQPLPSVAPTELDVKPKP